MFFADTCALPASGVVAVQEYGSSPRRGQRLVSTKTTPLLGSFVPRESEGTENESATATTNRG